MVSLELEHLPLRWNKVWIDLIQSLRPEDGSIAFATYFKKYLQNYSFSILLLESILMKISLIKAFDAAIYPIISDESESWYRVKDMFLDPLIAGTVEILAYEKRNC